jgi:ParB-like chromosome segregation protein Spo0J
MKIERLLVEDIDVGIRLRPIHEAAVAVLAESMQRLGQLCPISVYKLGDALRLVAGLHRLEAARRLGWIEIEAVFSTGNEIERELQEIAENLHRSELTVLERDVQIGRWAELTAAKVGQLDPPSGGAQPAEKGVRKVARELSLERKDVERALKVASISPEAQQAARDDGLGNNRSALLAVAKEATPEAQVVKVRAISSAKTAPKAENQPAATNAVEATGPIGALDRFAEFCRANLPVNVAPSIPPGEAAKVRTSIAIINEWIGQFVAALGGIEATDITAKAAETPRGPDVVPPAKHEPAAAASDPLARPRHSSISRPKKKGARRRQRARHGAA